MPRERTFPIRKCVVSRFPGGKILDGDFSQLEFRVAGFLAQDKVIYEDVYDGVDVHQVTADVMGVSRQDAKADTFKPLYGGTTGSEAQKRYYAEFKRKYFAVAQWHEELGEEVLATGKMVLPSGREYMYPGVKRMPWGTVSHATTIKNYPVQGFATADLVPCACVALHRMMKEKQVKSLFINTVHDNLVIDVHPDEVKELTEMLKCAMLSIADETKKRYGIEYDMPIGIEVKLGDNWMEMETVYE
jgi:DNA polymerase I-like protein with 3'-5' exonuclease and polymerase domains